MHIRTSSRPTGAFTLIELLTVIAIIAILMGLLFPAIMGVKEQARKAKAGSDIQSMVTAVTAYKTDYGRFPELAASGSSGGSSTTGNDELIGDIKAGITGKPNSLLFNTLRAIAETSNANHEQNPKKIVFFDGRRASNPAQPKEGFADGSNAVATTKGSLFDPWGLQYNLVFDTNGDNVIDVNQQYTDFGGVDAPRVQVGAFSLGKDEKLGDNDNKRFKTGTTKSDDIVSWQ